MDGSKKVATWAPFGPPTTCPSRTEDGSTVETNRIGGRSLAGVTVGALELVSTKLKPIPRRANADQIWNAIGNQSGNLTARARYAADTLKLGYDIGGGYVNAVNDIANNQLLVSNLGPGANTVTLEVKVAQ